MNYHSEQETLEKLKAHLYDGRDDEPAPIRANSLVENSHYQPKCNPMSCAQCGRAFGGGEFRVCYQVGWFCRYCYQLLSLAPLGARCIYCKEVIAIDCWRYKLHSAVSDGDDLKRYFLHQDCESAMRRLERAA